MKLIQSLIILCFATITAPSCTTAVQDSFTERSLETAPFNEVEISSGFIAVLEKADTFSVELEIPDKAVESLVAGIKDSRLTLGFETGIWDVSMRKYISLNRPKAVIKAPDFKDIKLYSAAELTLRNGFAVKDAEIEVSGASHISGMLKADHLEIHLSGASACRLDIEAVHADIEVSGASSLKSDIYADTLEIETRGASSSELEKMNENTGSLFKAKVSGASSLKAGGVPFRTVKAEASGASKAEVYATGELEADASGASKIQYTRSKGLVKETNARGASSVKAK